MEETFLAWRDRALEWDGAARAREECETRRRSTRRPDSGFRRRAGNKHLDSRPPPIPLRTYNPHRTPAMSSQFCFPPANPFAAPMQQKRKRTCSISHAPAADPQRTQKRWRSNRPTEETVHRTSSLFFFPPSNPIPLTSPRIHAPKAVHRRKTPPPFLRTNR